MHLTCKRRVQDNCGLTQKHFKELITHMVISARQVNGIALRISLLGPLGSDRHLQEHGGHALDPVRAADGDRGRQFLLHQQLGALDAR